MKICAFTIIGLAGLFFNVSCSFVEIATLGNFSSRRASEMKSSGPIITVRTTAYSQREKEKGGIYGAKSAAGNRLRYGNIRSAAADWSKFPVGTAFKIVGQPHLYVVDDYGRSLVGTVTIDLYKPTLRMMRSWGTRRVNIQVLRWGSLHRSADILKDRLHYAHVRKMYREISARLTKIAVKDRQLVNSES